MIKIIIADDHTIVRRGIKQILAGTPDMTVTDEAKDPYSLIQNIAHFYRVLGKRDVLRIREILTRESQILEPVASLFYDWAVSGDRCEGGIKGRPSEEMMYEYAAFFLDTLAGKSYLLRRDTRVRILTTYYSVLFLDRANREMLNRHGLDIRQSIDHCRVDLRNHRGLVSRKAYLDTLDAVQKKYEKPS